MFAIGDQDWPGISKLIEEMGEVQQICGKLLGTRGNLRHWNVPDLRVALEDELADLWAALTFVQKYAGLDQKRMADRVIAKLDKLIEWHTAEVKP